ncbi:TetR/AcrR family transcriptional regulator [Brevundimonas sp.]
MTQASESASAPYHHGNLRQALIEATVGLVAEGGVERVTIREIARRAGVSSGAPFRHFQDRSALILAVAEEGMARLRAAIASDIAQSSSLPPVERLSSVADAYFCWAVQNPTHYRLLGDRHLIGFYTSASLAADNGWIRAQTVDLLQAALSRPTDMDGAQLQIRALAYGLTRMHVDGHLREFGVVPDEAFKAMSRTMRGYIRTLVAPG